MTSIVNFIYWIENEHPEYFWGSEAGGVLCIAQNSKRLLIALRSQHVNEPGTWGIVGGKVDSGEDIQQAVRREFIEETGYHGTIQLLPAYVFKKSNFEYHNFIGIIPQEFNPTLNWESKIRVAIIRRSHGITE